MRSQLSAVQLKAARDELAKQPKWYFQPGGIEVDGAGRVWVATSRGGTNTDLDVFSPDGQFIGTRAVPGHVTAFAFRLPCLAVLGERQEGAAEGSFGVDLYRVE